MKMLHDTVLVSEIEEGGKIVVAESGSEIAKGKVEAVGPGQIGVGNGYFTVPTTVQVGQIVYYIRNHALKLHKFWAIRERDIVAIEE